MVEAKTRCQMEVTCMPGILYESGLCTAGRTAGKMKVLRKIPIEDAKGPQPIRHDVKAEILPN